MATSLTKVGGVVVITQVIPQDQASIPLQTPPLATPTSSPVTPAARRLVAPAPTKPDELREAFLQGGPQALGAVQVVVGLLCAAVALRAAFLPPLLLQAPLGLGVAFVVSGSLTLAALRKTSPSLVWAAALSNVISALVGLVGVAYLGFLMASYRPAKLFCDDAALGNQTDSERRECLWKISLLDVSEYGSLGLLLLLLLLQLCASIGVSVFSARAIRRRGRAVTVTEADDDDHPLLGAMEAAPDDSAAPLSGRDEDAAERSSQDPAGRQLD